MIIETVVAFIDEVHTQQEPKMIEKMNDEKHDDDLEYIASIWHELTYWQQLHIVFLIWWAIKQQWFELIPIRWIEYQINRECRRSRRW